MSVSRQSRTNVRNQPSATWRALATIVLAVSAVTVVATLAKAAGPAAADAALFNRLDADGSGQVTAQEVPAEQKQLFARLLRKADVNHDQALNRDEFAAGLEPTAAAKTLEEKPPAEFPGADAIRWLLLSMDTNMDGNITQAEVPEKFRTPFQAMISQVDRDSNGTIDRQELNQGGRLMSQIATRFAEQQQVDVAAELKKLERSQGAAAERFEGRRGQPQRPAMALGNPQQAQQTFAQLDANRDGQITRAEVPEPAQELFQQLMQLADLDRNGRLSQQEFTMGLRQLNARRGGPGGPRAGLRTDGRRGRSGGSQTPLEALGQGSNAAKDGSGAGSMEAMDAMPGGK